MIKINSINCHIDDVGLELIQLNQKAGEVDSKLEVITVIPTSFKPADPAPSFCVGGHPSNRLNVENVKIYYQFK